MLPGLSPLLCVDLALPLCYLFYVLDMSSIVGYKIKSQRLSEGHNHIVDLAIRSLHNPYARQASRHLHTNDHVDKEARDWICRSVFCEGGMGFFFLILAPAADFHEVTS